MKITVVGSGCGIPNARRGSPCIAVQVGRQLFAFDCGPGAARSMAVAGLHWTDLDRIFITHFHTDHIGDIAALLFAYNIPDVNRTGRLILCGPPGLKKKCEGIVAAYGDWLIPRQYELVVDELPGEPLCGEASRSTGWRVEIARAEHTQPAYAYRFEADGKSMVYSGDTDYSEAVVKLAAEADLLILECSYPDEVEVPGHLTPAKAGRMARAANCKKLVLTHLYPICADYDLVAECGQAFGGEVVVAEDGMQFDL